MTDRSTSPGSTPRHVSRVAIPDAVVSTLFGVFDVVNAFALMDMSNAGPLTRPPFHIDIVGEAVGALALASGVPLDVQRSIVRRQGRHRALRIREGVCGRVSSCRDSSGAYPRDLRRLFKRTTGLAPGAYRKRFRIPEFARR